ncbi:MAG: DMT family transporter [Acidobacteria bacterium]|nr:DMT family transporter [Acidobacteriota bacterium]
MTEIHSHPSRGYWLVASAALLWGASGVIARYLLGQQFLHPFDLLALRTWLAGLSYLTWLALTAPHLLRVERRDLWRFALFGLIGLAFNQACYYLALQRIGVGYALLLQYTMPAMLMAYGFVTRTEIITRRKVLAAALTLAGAALMMGGGAGGFAGVSIAGTLFAFGSALCFCFYNLAGQRLLQRYDARTVILYGFLFAGLLWLFAHPLWQINWTSFNARAWSLTLFIAVTGTVLPFVLYLAGLRHLEASRAGVTATTEPVFAAALAWALLGERMLPWQIAGGLAVLGGVLLIQTKGRRA